MFLISVIDYHVLLEIAPWGGAGFYCIPADGTERGTIGVHGDGEEFVGFRLGDGQGGLVSIQILLN